MIYLHKYVCASMYQILMLELFLGLTISVPGLQPGDTFLKAAHVGGGCSARLLVSREGIGSREASRRCSSSLACKGRIKPS